MGKILATPLFETVHPMTYLFTLQSALWGALIVAHILFPAIDLLDIGQLFWPAEVSYIWSASIFLAGVAMLLFYARDKGDKRKKRKIWYGSKINVALWVFAAGVWIVIGAEGMLVVSIWNLVGFVYIALASRFTRRTHRI